MGETRDEEENRLGERSDVQELGSAVEDLEIIRRRWKDGGDFLVLEVLHVCTEACEEGEIAFKLFDARAVLELLAETENGVLHIQESGEFDENRLGWRGEGRPRRGGCGVRWQRFGWIRRWRVRIYGKG